MNISNLKSQISKKSAIASCLLFIAYCLSPGFTYAADLNNLIVTSSVSPKEIKIGERIDFSISVEHDSGIDIFYPDETAQLSPFEVLKHKVSTRRSGFGRSATEIVYSITGFEAGEFTVPPLLVTAKDRFGNERNIRTVEHRVKVMLGAETGSDIVDILPPMDVTEKAQHLKKALSFLPYIVPFLAAIAVIAYLLTQRRPSPAITVDPRAKALEMLGALKVDENRMEIIYFDVSDIVRTFLAGHLGIEASKMTSTELLETLERLRGMEDLLDYARELFFDLDLVKFSPFLPSVNDAKEAISRAEGLIREVP